jgi:hypothetical protein
LFRRPLVGFKTGYRTGFGGWGDTATGGDTFSSLLTLDDGDGPGGAFCAVDEDVFEPVPVEGTTGGLTEPSK